MIIKNLPMLFCQLVHFDVSKGPRVEGLEGTAGVLVAFGEEGLAGEALEAGAEATSTFGGASAFGATWTGV